MLLKREQALKIQDIFEIIKSKKFNIHTQYKLIKIKRAIEEEQSIYQEQIKTNCYDFFELDSNGSPLKNNQGGYKIKQDKIAECYQLIEVINQCEVQLPDIYFTLDELIELDLTMEQLELLEPFIK